MTITKSEKENTVTLALDGWLDTITSPELKKEFDKIDLDHIDQEDLIAK